MSQQSRKEYLARIWPRYQRAGRKHKQRTNGVKPLAELGQANFLILNDFRRSSS